MENIAGRLSPYIRALGTIQINCGHSIIKILEYFAGFLVCEAKYGVYKIKYAPSLFA